MADRYQAGPPEAPEPDMRRSRWYIEALDCLEQPPFRDLFNLFPPLETAAHATLRCIERMGRRYLR
ncbi:MAG TPA: hypothetical protein VJB16_04205 [archaeon]|nr:hypothetical protein [archaeon]